MTTLITIKAWILICSITVVPSASTEHSSPHHDAPHHGGSTPQKTPQNTIVPFGIQTPDHILSTPDVACISADSNIFEIMNNAQETCNGTDMRCTFYHFVNHGYQNIGTLDIDKELFDDLLMKFDNWLLTTEDIETDVVPLEAKTKEDSVLDTATIANGSHSNEEPIKSSTNVSETERIYTNHGVHIDKVDHNTHESDADKVVNTHNIKNLYDTPHRNHHHKWKNGNHIKLVPEYNNEHKYFEVFLPKDQETGKPRTIYVEVDKEKNEFVLLDEEIDKKLNGTKPIRIELDELSEIADTAFNNIAKSAKEHIKSNLFDDEISDLYTNSTLHEDETHLDIDVGDCSQNILNVCYPNMCNINANQQLIPDNITGFSKKIINVSKNLVVPNKYINQAQFYVESQIENTTDVLPNDHLELLESSNIIETDIYQTGSNDETPHDTLEFNENNTDIDLDLDNIECSLENFDIPCDHNSTENSNTTLYDDSFIDLEENNDTSIDIVFNDTYGLSSSETIHLNEPLLQAEKPVEENNPNSTPNIYTEQELTSSLTAGITDYISSQLDAIPSENRQAHMDHSLAPDVPLSPYTTVPLLGRDLAKVLETDGHLQSSFPVYATLDLPTIASQNTPLNYDFEHPSISSYSSPLASNFGHESSEPKKLQSTFPIFPSPPVECIVRLNKGSKYSPFNFGFSWLPSYTRVEELRLPCAMGALQQEPILQVPVQKNKQLSDSICTESPSPDHTIPIEYPRICQTVPSLSVDSQKPYYLEANPPMSPKNVLPSNLPKSSSDSGRISTPYQLSDPPLSAMSISLKDPANSPCPTQQISPYLHPTKPNQDLGFIKYSPFDNNSKEIMIPCAANQYRFPYTTIPYFLNPCIQPPQSITPYLEPILPVAPIQSASKILSLDSLPLSSDQSYPCLEEDYSKANKPIPLVLLAPNTPFSPLNTLSLGPGFVPNTLPCQNLWNNIPTLPCTMLSEQNIRNYPPIVNNHLTPGVQQNQILKPLLSNSVPLSVLEQSCPIKNILEMKPSSYTPFLTPVQMNLNPSLALERDLQSLSLKYGIPLTKILNSLETEISDIYSKTSLPTLEAPYSNLVHDSPLKTEPNAVLYDDNRSGYEESLLETDLFDFGLVDSSLIGPHLEIESSLMLEANDSKSNTVVSETTIPTLHFGFKNQKTKLVHDSSLIGPHLPTLSLSHFDENRNANEVVISESEYSNLKRLDSSLIGPYLEIGSPPIELDSNNSQGDILTSHTEVPITTSSQLEPKLNLNQPTHLVLDSSLIGSHLPSLTTVKPNLSDEIQNINDIILLGSDLTDLTPLDSSVIHTQEDLVNQLDQTEIFKHENTAVTLLQPAAIPSTKLPPNYFPKKLVEKKLLLQSDSLIPLDSSLIGPGLKLGSSPLIIDSLEDKTVPLVSKESLQNTDNKLEELESINLSSSLLTTLLKKPVVADSNLNIITHETKLNKELNKVSLDTNVGLPLTDISQTYQETDFKTVEPILELTSLIDNRNIPVVTKDSRPLKNKSDSSDTTHGVDDGSILDHFLTGTSILYKLENPEISTSVDSAIHLDSSLVGPSILQEIDSRAPTTINQNKKPSEISTAIDSLIKLESSFKGPTLHHEVNSKETSSAFESVTQFENFLVPSRHETKESSATASVLNSIQLDSSLIGPSLHQEKLEVSRAFDSKDILDSSLIGQHLLTAVPFSGEEIQMINEELQPKLDLVNLITLNSSLIGPHIDFDSELEQSKISRYQNPELIKTSVSNPEASETREFVPSNLDEGMTPLEPIIVPSVCTCDHQELLSKITNAVTKTQLSPSGVKPCDKSPSSIAKISPDNYVLQSGKDLQTFTLNTLLNTPLSLQDELASEFSPLSITSPAHDFLPVESIKCVDSNNTPTPKMLAESLPYVQGVSHIPPMPYSPFLQMKPLIDRNWVGLNNIQNILQTSPSFRPVIGNAPIPFISNALPITSEYLKSILYLPSYSKLYPQLSIPDMYTPGDAIALASECTKPSNNYLPLNEYIPLLPNNNFSLLPSNLQSTVSKSEYKPIVVDDIMSLLDENSLQLSKDMSILPFRECFLLPTTPFFENGEIVPPSLLETVSILDSGFIQTRPLLPIPISNPLVPSPTNNPQIHLYNPQNVPFMILHAPNISPFSLQPYSNLPLHSEYSEIIGPAPKITSLPTEYPKAFLQLSKPCVESPIILPCSSLDTMLQLPTASNELNSGPCQVPPKHFTSISPIYTNPLTNAYTSPILPIYASPLSVFYAQSTPSTSLALNVPYRDSPLRPVSLPINPYTAIQLSPKYSSPVTSDYPHPPTVAHNIPIPLEIPYMPSQTYSSPYLSVHTSTLPIDTSAGSPIMRCNLPPAMTSPISPSLSTPYYSPLPKSLTSLGSPAYSSPLAPIALGTLAPISTGPLVPSYLSPTKSYPSLPDLINAQTRPAYIAPISTVSSSLSSYNTPITLNPISSPNPQMKPESQTLRILNTLPNTNAVNPFLNIKQRLPKNPNIQPIQSYATHVPISNYNTQIKQNIPCEDALESNLLTSVLTEELPMYDVTEENAYTYSNDKDDKYYEDPTLKYPLESLSYTLAPEEITEYLPNEDYIKLEDLSPSAPVNNHASEPSLQSVFHAHHRLAPYTPLHSKPVLKLRPAPQIVQPPSLLKTIPQNIYDNTPLVTSSSPLKHAVSLPTSILSSPLLKPLSPLTIAAIDTPLTPYNNLPLNEKLQFLSSSPFYSTPNHDTSPPIYPTKLRNIVIPQVIPAFSQVPTNAPFVTVSSSMSLPTSQLTATPYILNNYNQLPSTLYEPRLKTLKSPGSLIKPSPTPTYTQFAAPIISHVSPLEMPITPQYISSPLPTSQSLKKTNPFISSQYISSILPTQATLQDRLLLNKTPIHYQPYIEQPIALTSSANNVFRTPPVTSPYTVLPSVNMVEPDLNRPQSSSFTPQYSLQSSCLSVSKYSPTVPHSNIPYSSSSPHIPKKTLTNNIIPSSLFMYSDTDFQPTKNRLAPLYNIPRYSSPTPFLSEPLQTVPFTPSRPLDTTTNPTNILKPKLPLSNVQYTVPLPSSLQPLQPVDSYQTQPHTNVQYAAKTHRQSPPLQAQYASLSLAPQYAPKQLITKPSTPQFSISSVPVYDSKNHSLPLGRNPFLNPDFKPITEVPSYPVPNNIITSSILAPSEHILLSNLRHIDISPESQNSYSVPITYSTPFISSSLLKPSAIRWPQNAGQYRPDISSNSQYVSQSPMNNTPLQKSSLLQPLLANSQNNAPLVPMHFSNTNKAFPEGFPIESVTSVTSPGIALSNYLPYDSSDHKYSGPCVSEISELGAPINPLTTAPYILSKPPFDKHFKSPVSTQTNVPLYSMDDILEPSPELLTKANIINTVMPIEVSGISASQSSPLSIDSLDTETIEEIKPNKLIADLKDRFSLMLGFNKQGQSHPAYASKYLATPQPTITMPPSKYKTTMPRPSFSIPSLISEETEFTHVKDLIPLSQIKSEPLIDEYSPSERKAPSNIQERHIVQLSPYTSLLNSDFPPSTYKQIPPNIQTPSYINQLQEPSPIYLSPQEYKDLIQGLSTSQSLSTHIPQLTPSPLTGGLSPQIPLYTSSMSIKPEKLFESPILVKSVPLQEKLLKVTPKKENISPLHDKYRIANKITPQGNDYAYEPKSTISEIISELNCIHPLLNSKEPYTEYIDDLKSNKDNYYDPESDNGNLDENKPDVFDAKPTKNLLEVIKGMSIPNYIKIPQRAQKISKLDHFYANNHIGKGPQVFNVPTSPTNSPAEVASPYTTMTPEILKDATVIPTKHFGSKPKSDTTSLRPSESYTERADSPENVPITNSYPHNYLNPCLKYSSQMKSLPNTIEIADTSEITPTSYKNIDDIKYSGYKTYHIPLFKPPQSLQNLGGPTRMYSPSVEPYSSIPAAKPSNVQQTPSLLYYNLYSPLVVSEPLISQYQTPILTKTPLQTKLGIDSLEESPELNEYNPVEDIPTSADSINDDNELKTSLINYMNKREDIKNNLYNNNAEVTIPIGNIAITRKEPYNDNTIETNNPSIGLKVWKSNVKIAQAELKLKFKDLSVNNFMPIVYNLDKYDKEEIRKIVKNYIDEKYGNHIEINEPYNIDNKYTVIKDFDPNGVGSKYNLLWPTSYI